MLRIQALDKPEGVWCKHCNLGKGCSIYSSKPTECSIFHCGYLTNPHLGEEWKPSHSKIVLCVELDGNRITAYVDRQRPDAWKREPYYSTLKQWEENAVPYRGQVMACVGSRMYMIFPDRDVDLGEVNTDEELIVTGERMTPTGIQLDAFKIHKDDPRAKQLAPQQCGEKTLKKE